MDLNDNILIGPFLNMQPLSLDEVFVNYNFLSGSLPKSFGSLREVHARNNKLTGTISEYIDEGNNLQSLDLRGNLLTGELPIYENSFGSLRNLYLSQNFFTGTIPLGLFVLPNIELIDLSYNSFKGTIPDDFSDGVSVLQLNLQHNSLHGTLPENLIFASGLVKLYLNNNNFSGQFPKAYEHMYILDTLTIESNDITGNLPYQNCDQFELISCDCAPPNKVSCFCCECHGLYTNNAELVICPSDDSKVIIDNVRIGHPFNFKLRNEEDEHYILEDDQSIPLQESFEYPVCFSSTGCYSFNIYSDENLRFRIFFAGENILEVDELPQTTTDYLHTSVSFGYSSQNGILLQGVCDNITLDDISIESNTAKRVAVNQLVKVSGAETVTNSSSQKYQALYWSLNRMGRNTETDHVSLFQLYVLALFYSTTSGDQWLNNSLWLSESSECDWFGIHCDSYSNTIITKIDLSSNALKGYIPSEIGELRGLEEIYLKDNALTGIIPFAMMANLESIQIIRLSNNFLFGSISSEIKYHKNLLELDLSLNELTYSLPRELGNLGILENLDLSHNGFNGELPKELVNATKLIRLNLRNNTFNGNVFWLKDLIHLELLWLADNYFSGTIPIGQLQKNMTTFDLSGNQLKGSIPSSIANMLGLEELYIFNNHLTGTIPAELGMLNLVNVSLSYNEIKGTLHSEIGNIKTLKLLYLHSNLISGQTDVFDYDIDTYITDCGELYLTCNTCSDCCLKDGNCLQINKTWPKSYLSSIKVRPDLMVLIILSLFVFIGFFSSGVVLRCFVRDYLPRFSTVQRIQFQSESVYKFFLTKDWRAWSVAIFALALQAYVLLIFVTFSNFNYDFSDWVFTKTCLPSGIECNDLREKTIGPMGWYSFIIVISVFLFKDVLDALSLIYEGVTVSDVRGIFAGSVVLFITCESAIASYLFNYAAGASETDILKDAAVLLFLTDVDEQVYIVVERFFPEFLESIDEKIKSDSNVIHEKLGLYQHNDPLTGPLTNGESNDSSSDDSEYLRGCMERLEAEHNILLKRFNEFVVSQNEKEIYFQNNFKICQDEKNNSLFQNEEGSVDENCDDHLIDLQSRSLFNSTVVFDRKGSGETEARSDSNRKVMCNVIK